MTQPLQRLTSYLCASSEKTVHAKAQIKKNQRRKGVEAMDGLSSERASKWLSTAFQVKALSRAIALLAFITLMIIKQRRRFSLKPAA
jgi:hypothetical protein